MLSTSLLTFGRGARSVALCLALIACERRTVASDAPSMLGERAPSPRSDAPLTSQSRPATDEGPRVVFLGDSISAGLHLPSEQAFPAVLQRMLAERGQPFRLVNAGVSGDTSAGGVRRLAWLLKQAPDIVVIELGANDGLRAVAVADVEKNLTAMLTEVRARGATPLLLGIRIPPSYGEPYVSEFAALYERVARAQDVAFVPFFMEGVAGVPALNLPDGIHPTEEGHRMLAARVLGPLAELLRARQ